MKHLSDKILLFFMRFQVFPVGAVFFLEFFAFNLDSLITRIQVQAFFDVDFKIIQGVVKVYYFLWELIQKRFCVFELSFACEERPS